jgi:PAS domain S-box-containing protein
MATLDATNLLRDLIDTLDEAVLAALDAAKLGMAITIDDGEGPVPLYLSDIGAEILGYHRDELIGRSTLHTIAPEELPALRQRLADRRREQGHATGLFETVIIRKSGERVPIEIGFAPLPHESDDHRVALIVFFRDIRDRKAMLSRLALSDRMATVGTVAAGVAHEVNNPLTHIFLNLDQASRSLARIGGDCQHIDAVEQAIDRARDGARRVRDIVGDLKTFFLADDQRREVDLRHITEAALRIANPNLRLKAAVSAQLSPVRRVMANESRLGQVVLNLLVNAAQAIPESDPSNNEVVVRTAMLGERWVMLEVTDTGCGMTQDVLRRIFDPFFTTKPIGVGTGLGLSICHKIITELGGEIQAESEPGRGSLFRVLVPAAGEVKEPGDGL